MKKSKTSLLILSLIFFFQLFTSTQNHELQPGVERWLIKTTLPEHSLKKRVSIDDLLKLANPISSFNKKFDTTRITTKVSGLKEGDIVTTTAWLHLVALENDSRTHRDGDYHIQLRNSPLWSDSCFIVEVPLPEFVSDPELKENCSKVREFIRHRLLKDKEPGTHGNKMIHQVYVTVTGQLFFDASHMRGNPRGKRGMKSYTPWEIHPVISIKFAPLPK